MIKMIFEGGYVYDMTSGEYYILLVLAVIGAATVIGAIATIGTLLIKKIIYKIKNLKN